MSGTILNNVLKTRLAGSIPGSVIAQLTASVRDLNAIGLSPAQQNQVVDAYMQGIHVIFITYAPILGICFLLSLLVKDDGLAEKDAASRQNVADQTEPGQMGAVEDFRGPEKA